MDHLDILTKIIAIVAPIFCGLIWVVKRIERGQAKLLQKINRIDKKKVSYKSCDQRRANCPYKYQNVEDLP